MKLARFKHINIGFTTIVEEAASKAGGYSKDYAQVSDWVEVEFPPLSCAQTAANELAALEDRETERRLRFDLDTKKFDAEHARLRALMTLPHGEGSL
jgi:hypothetical protein